jgi:AcrR family transcriptional regulator
VATLDAVPEARALAPLRVEEMTSSQLARRARLIETVIALIGEVGVDTIQMRDVSDRSHVATGTVYRYFGSKDQLLAAAFSEWQLKLTRRLVAGHKRADADPRARLDAYLSQALRAFHRNPEMAKLIIQLHATSDPDLVDAINRITANDEELMRQLLTGVPERDFEHIRIILGAVLMNTMLAIVSGRVDLSQADERVRGVTRFVLAPRADRPAG